MSSRNCICLPLSFTWWLLICLLYVIRLYFQIYLIKIFVQESIIFLKIRSILTHGKNGLLACTIYSMLFVYNSFDFRNSYATMGLLLRVSNNLISFYIYMKKFTLSTLKSILKNKDCEILNNSSFCGMTDCVQNNPNAQWEKIRKPDFTQTHTFGIFGIWLVKNSRDHFTVISDNCVKICNCCGSFTVRWN